MKLSEITLYHGSGVTPQPRFRAAHTGNNSHTFGPYQSTRWGIFFSDNPNFAGLYGNVKEYNLNLKNTANLDLFGGELISRFVQTLDAHDPHQREIYLQATWHQHMWQLFDDETGAAFTKFLRRQGYDSASFTEYNEDDNGEEHKSLTTVVFNPRTVR